VSQVAVPWVGAAGYGAVVPLDVDPRWAHDVGDDHDANLMERASSAGLPDAEVIDRTGEPVTEICAAADDARSIKFASWSSPTSCAHRGSTSSGTTAP
jgi:hypothetical protein